MTAGALGRARGAGLRALLRACRAASTAPTDLLALRRQEASERAQVRRLQRRSSTRSRATPTAIERDPRVQERVARERFGMIRRGELLYRLVPPDSTRR